MHGSKYEQGRDTAEIAKLIRKDIADALKSGALPKGLKVSVRISRFSMGSSIDLTITDAPMAIINRAWAEAEIRRPTEHSGLYRQTPEARSLASKLQNIAEAYRMDESDSQSDYFHCNFYLHIQFAGFLERAEMANIRAEIESEKEIADVSTDPNRYCGAV